MLTIKRGSKKLSNTPSKKARSSNKKKVLGLYNDSLELKAILASLSVNKIVIESIDNSKLLSPLKQIEEISGGESEEDLEGLSAEDIFGISNKSREGDEANPFKGEVSEGEEETPVSNEDVLLALLCRVPAKKFNIAINLPSPIMNTIILKNVYDKLKNKERRAKIHAEISQQIHGNVPKDQYAYIATDKDQLFAFGYMGDVPLIQTYDAIRDRLEQKHKFQILNPNEISVLNLISYNYAPKEEEIIVIVDITQNESRIIMTKGGKFIHMAPIIREGSSTPSVLNTLKGKLLYEQDIGNIPDFDLLVLTGKSKQLEAKEFFQKNLGLENVEYVKLNSEKFVASPEDAASLQNFTGALGLVVTALKSDEKNLYKVDLLPAYIQKRQQVFIIAWHGILVLILILFMPMALNWLNNSKRYLKESYEREVESLDRSIEDLNWVGPLVDSLIFELGDLQAEYIKLDSLARGTRRTTVTINKIYRTARDVNGLWFTDVNVKSSSVEITGYSIYRNRIPLFIKRFPRASIESIAPTEIREKVVYQFKVVIENITQDEKEFNPIVE